MCLVFLFFVCVCTVSILDNKICFGQIDLKILSLNHNHSSEGETTDPGAEEVSEIRGKHSNCEQELRYRKS